MKWSSPYEGDTGSCLAGVLWRIFCPNSFPAFPVGCTDAKVEDLSSREEEFDPGAVTPVPGIVARLMGLETLPQRNRSMNDLRSSIKSTSSFRETPTYLEIENDEFLVLIFENGTKRERKKRKKRRNRASILMTKESNSPNENSATEQNQKPVEMSSLTKLRNVKSDPQGIIPMDKQAEIGCCSENSSSPVSVLEFGEFTASDLEASASDEWRWRLQNRDRDDSDKRGNREPSSRSNLESRIHPEDQITLFNDATWKYDESSQVDLCSELGCQIWCELIDDLIVQLSCVSTKNKMNVVMML